MNEKSYDKVIKWLGIVFAAVTLLISIFFSSWGFAFDMNNYSWAILVSLALGATITVIELNGQKSDRVDPVFRVIWLLSYAYGTYTNVVGLSQIRGGAFEWHDYILPILVGLFIEIVPEKLFLKSLRELNAMQKSYTPQPTAYHPRDTRNPNNQTSHAKPKQAPTPGRSGNLNDFFKDIR